MDNGELPTTKFGRREPGSGEIESDNLSHTPSPPLLHSVSFCFTASPLHRFTPSPCHPVTLSPPPPTPLPGHSGTFGDREQAGERGRCGEEEKKRAPRTDSAGLSWCQVQTFSVHLRTFWALLGHVFGIAFWKNRDIRPETGVGADAIGACCRRKINPESKLGRIATQWRKARQGQRNAIRLPFAPLVR